MSIPRMTPPGIPDWSAHIDALEPDQRRPAGGEARDCVEREVLLHALKYDLDLIDKADQFAASGIPATATIVGEHNFLNWREWWRRGYAGFVVRHASVR